MPPVPEGAPRARAVFDLSWTDPFGKRFSLSLGRRTLIMGVINVTPDSFYDGGRCPDPAAAVERALRMQEEGADLIDVGGESSRPGSAPLSENEELKRVLPVLERLAGKIRVPLSIDTWKARVAREALKAGAQVINDISALRFDPAMAATAAAASGPVVLMHMQGTPRDMQVAPRYGDLLKEIGDFFQERLRWTRERGIASGRVIIDPGIGFGKTLEHNLRIIAGLGSLAEAGRPLLVGPSRKSFIGALLDRPPEGRLMGTAGAVAIAVRNGAHIVRVHDVREMKDVVTVVDRILESENAPS